MESDANDNYEPIDDNETYYADYIELDTVHCNGCFAEENYNWQMLANFLSNHDKKNFSCKSGAFGTFHLRQGRASWNIWLIT